MLGATLHTVDTRTSSEQETVEGGVTVVCCGVTVVYCSPCGLCIIVSDRHNNQRQHMYVPAECVRCSPSGYVLLVVR